MKLLFVQYPPEVCFYEERLVYGWWAESNISFAIGLTCGEEHFVQCYLRHVMLFKAIKRRYPWLRLQVDDPTRYWQTGSLEGLLRKTRRL